VWCCLLCFFQAEDGIRDATVTGVQTCALPIYRGVGNFLAKGHLLSEPSAVDSRWLSLAPDNQARMQVPTLRNVDKRPSSDFVKEIGRASCREREEPREGGAAVEKHVGRAHVLG